MQLIGRTQELAELVERLDSRRLVTLIGPGGIGKTSLARVAAEQLAGRYELGSSSVDLTRVDAGDAVGSTIADQLGFGSWEELIDSPIDQSVLLLVDNCEHVTDAAAEAVAAILESCAAPTIVATSRSPLDVVGESLMVLGPLPVPTLSELHHDVASIRLFLERARDAGADLGDDQLDAVAELCRRLDGVPLALEIAAARTRALSPAEILARLDDRIDVLSRPRFRGAQRHRSVSDTIDWSYRILDDDVAAFFDGLGVFAGEFTAEAAHAVAAPAGADRAAADRMLEALVDASLVVIDLRGDITWYRQLETVRRFALDRLSKRGGLDATQDRFVQHVVQRAIDIIIAGSSGWGATVMSALLGHYGNIVAALRWCLEHDTDGRRSLLLCSVLWGVIHNGHVEEIAQLARRTLDRWPDSAQPFAAEAVATHATAVYLTGHPTSAIELAEAALATVDAEAIANVTLHRVIAQAWRALGDTERSMHSWERAAAEARARGNTGWALEADVARALVLADIGRLDEALEIIDRVSLEAARLGFDINEAWSRAAEGYIRLRIDPAAAMTVIEDALALSRRIGYPTGVVMSMRSLAIAHIASGDLARAAHVSLDVLDELTRRGALSDLHVVFDTTAVILHKSGRESWGDIAATTRSLPVVSMMASVGHELFPLPPIEGSVLARRDAIALARRELQAVLEGDGGIDSAATEQGSPTDEAVLSVRGDVCEVRFAGRTVTLKTSKGLVDLARLLSAPGREIHCLELMGAGVEQASTGEVIDETARRQYEQRVRELQADVDAAEADNDFMRADAARFELDALVDHLTSALGLGGRRRRGASSAERARSAVTQRLRATIRRIGEVNPELGRHLEVSITTGTFCSYRPEHSVSWRT